MTTEQQQPPSSPLDEQRLRQSNAEYLRDRLNRLEHNKDIINVKVRSQQDLTHYCFLVSGFLLLFWGLYNISTSYGVYIFMIAYIMLYFRTELLNKIFEWFNLQYI